MARSASSYNFESQSRMLCLCNVEVLLVTSWTEDNPEKGFYGCGLYRWHNPIVNSREKRIIVALMKKVKEKGLQTKISEMKAKIIFGLNVFAGKSIEGASAIGPWNSTK
ncbi:hypothetical protein GmHk_15G044332 [Glycine max]|nr:hypothetical protein GmHk_15G044332 [Glycine max]